MQQHRALILRSNRFLGSALIDRGLVSVGDLEEANGVFMEAIQVSDLRRASILSTLLFELKKLDEAKLLDYLAEEEKLGLVDLNFVDLGSLRPMNIDLSLCWASSTVPFDHIEGTYMVATCYYLSAPVKKHWEDLLNGRIVWFGTSTSSLSRALERIEEIHDTEDSAADDE
ncbi:hypothetical protein OAA45_01110 [bacterium]|nr:hypothetical protein [bacterium]